MPALDLSALHFLRPWWLLALLAAVAMTLLRLAPAAQLGIHHRANRCATSSNAEEEQAAAAVADRAGASVAASPRPDRHGSGAANRPKTDAGHRPDLSLSVYSDVELSRLVRARHAVTDPADANGFTGSRVRDAHTVLRPRRSHRLVAGQP
jgi:hypothetical protein